ncbi:disease resistance protein PIK6-NP-like [Lolium perenne]|uniref:disease resistance protein PIK6-NP-like n=1 Tax=Lolium perenne TaxID=4522 RepID=UPI0021EA6748|nr:disease resistance protein PIK6-NP-like [Lolium perenne]
MADLTQGAVDSLVGLLSTAITDERKLLGGVQGDMQFIKDEMESMNGFLLHLNKSDGTHDDQVRAWMKQVRDIAYIAQDCIELYRRDFAGPIDAGLWARLRYLPKLIACLPARHRLANKIRELKVRVHDVGDRRQRYDINIPPANTAAERLADSQSRQVEIDEDRDAFERALALDKEKKQPSFDGAIGLLASKDLRSAATTVRAALYKCLMGYHNGIITGAQRMFRVAQEDRLTKEETEVICIEVVLRALRAHSQDRRTAQTKEDILRIVKEADCTNLPNQLMIFCYSNLSRSQKSCLQYLYAFHEETSISRTSLVRRWLAEGLVERKVGRSLEEAAELCFKELLFRGFLLPHDRATATGKVKSCKIHKTIWEFVYTMSTSENFVSDLPTHLNNQLRLRGFVMKQQWEMNQRPREVDSPRSMCGFHRPTRHAAEPMEEMVKLLKSLPETYRLNVLDLGGCRGLKKSHLKTICQVQWLKYLSLRNTGISQLTKQINNLRLLEKLDIRQTALRQRDTEHIYLPKLKHLLTTWTETIYTGIPRNIGSMIYMEILSQVQVQHDHPTAKKELEDVSRLQLRKLGVVLGGSEAQENMDSLLQAITRLRDCLRSLSVRITSLPTSDHSVKMDMAPQQNVPNLLNSLHISGLGNTALPSWILQLHQLSEITLFDSFMSKEYLQELGKNLQHLRSLRLRSKSCGEEKLTFNNYMFQDLRFLIVESDTITTLEFEEEGATPNLKKIVWCNMPNKQPGTLSGVHHLRSLEEVVLKGHFLNLNDIQVSIGTKLRYP